MLDNLAMKRFNIFISSVQKEFVSERRALRDYLQGDPLMRRFFDVFLFEDLPATDQHPDRIYLDEVEKCDIYVGLFGREYGTEDANGISPTEREFDCATTFNKYRLIFLKEVGEGDRHPKMQALVGRAKSDLVWSRVTTVTVLVTELHTALIDFLENKNLVRSGSFDSAPCANCSLDDLDLNKMKHFIRVSRDARKFRLPESAAGKNLLEHLNLIDGEILKNAAILLFGKEPQRFLLSSMIKCAHFHGTQVGKPIPSYQVYNGTVFELIDQAVDFVLSKIDRSVGTRANSIRVPVSYEIPKEVVTEAIVNAVAHRDYTSNGSVQVMLFKNRLEVWNPGRLPPELTIEKLRVAHGSVPHNPLLAESLYLAEYIERMGTGTLDMINRCFEAGLSEPDFSVEDGFVTTVWRHVAVQHRSSSYMHPEVTPEVAPEVAPQVAPEVAPQVAPEVTPEVTPEVAPEVAPEVTPEVRNMLSMIKGEMSRREIQAVLKLKDEKHFREFYQQPAIAQGLIEMTIPDKPRSRNQKYRITQKGKMLLTSQI